MARLVRAAHFPPLDLTLILSACPAAMSDFAKKQDEWYSTWPQSVDERAFIM